jgi:hypothetical protein
LSSPFNSLRNSSFAWKFRYTEAKRTYATSSVSQGDRPLDAGQLDSALHLVTVERLSPAVILDDDKRRLLDVLLGGETATAFQAFATPADDPALVAGSRVDDFTVFVAAKRAAHGSSFPNQAPAIS